MWFSYVNSFNVTEQNAQINSFLELLSPTSPTLRPRRGSNPWAKRRKTRLHHLHSWGLSSRPKENQVKKKIEIKQLNICADKTGACLLESFHINVVHQEHALQLNCF